LLYNNQASPPYNSEPADDYDTDEDVGEEEPINEIPPPETLSAPTMISPEASPPPEDGGGDEPLPTSTVLIPNTGGGDDGPTPTPIAISMDLNTVYQQVIASLPQGSALFNPTEKMRLGEVETVEVRVVPITESQIEESDEVKATLTTDFEGGQEVVIIPLRVSTVMRARLSGENFTVVPLMEEEQIRLPDDPYLRWMWEVTPQKKGEQRLTLTLSVVVNAEGLGDKTHVTTEVRKVQVSGNLFYSITHFFNSNWEWVITGLLIPAAGWGWNKLRARRRVAS
jgi:hypothetical protein